MAQLKDSLVDGNLDVIGNINLRTGVQKGIMGLNPKSGEMSSMLYMGDQGTVVLGYGGYLDADGNTSVCGNDINILCKLADALYRPYYRAGDVINFVGDSGAIRTAGYVTNSGKNVVFTISVSKPVIGSPTITVSSGKGFVLRQNNSYTHGSAASTFVTPTSYSVVLNNSGFVVTAIFDVTTNVINNDAIGIYWDGTITLS